MTTNIKLTVIPTELLFSDDACMDAGGTSPGWAKVEQCMEQLSRATHGAVAEET